MKLSVFKKISLRSVAPKGLYFSLNLSNLSKIDESAYKFPEIELFLTNKNLDIQQIQIYILRIDLNLQTNLLQSHWPIFLLIKYHLFIFIALIL